MEQIYTIPINEHFDASLKDPKQGCPVCSLCRMLEENEIDLILGASMMEPDVRIKTNKEGFCPVHSGIMFNRKNRLGMALTLESHLDELRSEVGDLPLLVPGSRARHRIEELEGSCYVCRRIASNYTHMIENLIYIWENDPDFRVKFSSQPYFCLPHWRSMLEAAKVRLNRKMNGEFARAASEVVLPYFDSLREDISWFCKKFDYRYSEEPWGNSKDSVERALKFLRGDVHVR
ncbi:MAG: hypothetical protein J6V48_06980 [Clostridia bacterium]|jgi:hypothetical protein|nr:hypothetical protein [Clostridia bacterium]MBO7360857.1 hypothetical protein [Clostridia bacterium]MCR4683801.1 DUF6062 family protein [Clostridiales bacterium]